HEGAAEMAALGESRSRLAGRHVDEVEVGGSRLVCVVVCSDVLETIEPILEDHRGCLDHEEVNSAELLDGGPLDSLQTRLGIASKDGQDKGCPKHHTCCAGILNHRGAPKLAIACLFCSMNRTWWGIWAVTR